MTEHLSGYNGSVMQRLTSSSLCRSVTCTLLVSDFASYLKDYWMEKRCVCDNVSKIDVVKYYVAQ